MTEDTFKGWYHAGIGALIGVAAAYNVIRLCATGKRRNAINAALYVPLAVYEFTQARYHWRQS